MTSTPLRIGFLGAGLIATFHSKMLRAAEELIERAGVYDVDPARAHEFAARSGHTACGSEEAVIEGCDAVYVCTWTSEHRRLVELAATHGKAVFCEKPLATSLADAQAMADTVASSGVPAQVGLILRYSPAWALAEDLLNDEASGALLAINFRDDQYIPTQGTYRSTWRADVDKAGAGTLLEHSIHDVDQLLRLGGDLSAVSATTRFRHNLPGIEDVAVCMFGFESGAVASLTSVWHDNLNRKSQRFVELICERRHITLAGDDFFGPVTWEDADGARHTVADGQLVAQTESLLPHGHNPDVAFVRSVLEGRTPGPGFAEALAAQRVVDACYRSAEANR